MTAVTAGYSGTPLAKKLGIKDGHAVALLGAPEGFDVTDITEDTVRGVCLPTGLVDNKVRPIDDVSSGLPVVWREALRATERPATES